MKLKSTAFIIGVGVSGRATAALALVLLDIGLNVDSDSSDKKKKKDKRMDGRFLFHSRLSTGWNLAHTQVLVDVFPLHQKYIVFNLKFFNNFL